MSNPILITDPNDPRLADFRDLQERDRRGEQSRPGFFIGETALVVEKMLAIPGLTRSVLVAESHVSRLAPLVGDDTPLYAMPLSLMRSVAGFNIHRGVLAVGSRPAPDRCTLEVVVPQREGPLTLLGCERINNMDNIGMLFRNAAAFAVDAVVLSPRCHDPLYRKSIRVSAGHVLTTPWARSDDWHQDLRRLQRDWGISLVGAVADKAGKPLNEVVPPPRVALLVGPEFEGLAPDTQRLCDHLVRIPMAAGVDSLNVHVAGAVCLHHFSQGERR